MTDTFGQTKSGQRELEGGGFYMTPNATCKAGQPVAFGTSGLFGIPDIEVPAGTRAWFNNGALGETRLFDAPMGWTGTAGTIVAYKDGAICAASTAGSIKIGFQVDVGSNSKKVKCAISLFAS